MTFSPAPRDPDNPTNVQAWHSETGRWCLEIERVMFGYRVQLRAGYLREPAAILDYCAGANREWVEALATVLQRALLPLSEHLGEFEVRAHFPNWNVRPMARDPRCWRQLCELAQVDSDLPLEEIADLSMDVAAAAEVQLRLQLRMAGFSPAAAESLARQMVKRPAGQAA